MIEVTGDPFGGIIDYLGAVVKSADQLYLEAASDASKHVENQLNDQAEIFGAPKKFSTFYDENHGVMTGVHPDTEEEDVEKIFDTEYGTLTKPPTGFIRGTLTREKGDHFSRILSNKLNNVRP